MSSIRGFAENSLQGNSINLLLTEYRFLANQNLYLHSILDYGLYQDQTSPENKKFNNLISVGIGIGILTSNGLLKLTIANGTINNSNIKFYNSILNLSYNVKF
jgi:hemolysin activation/secretion protein